MSPQPRRILPQPMYREAFSSAKYMFIAQMGWKSERARATISDKTDRVESLEQLADRMFGQFLESALDAVVIADIDGRIIRLNTRAEKLFGYSRQELIGRDVEVLIPPRFRERHVEQRTTYLDNPKTRPMGTGLEVYGLRKDGSEFSAEISLSLVPFQEGFVVASAIRDVTEHRRIEDELRERAHKLEEADRHKDEFLGMLAHELRNPLGTIRNAVEVLGQLAPPDSDLRFTNDVIARQTQHMAHLVDDLLDVTRIVHGKVTIRKEPVELSQIVDTAVESSRRFVDARKQQLTVSLPARPVQFMGDPTRLVQILANLLNNAAKYTDEAGRISLSAAEEKGEVVVRVRDTGIGIAPEMLPRVFDLFTQVPGAVNRSEGGIGIGLAIVDRLVQLHGGTIQAFSEGPGRGTEFVVHLPDASISRGQGAESAGFRVSND